MKYSGISISPLLLLSISLPQFCLCVDEAQDDDGSFDVAVNGVLDTIQVSDGDEIIALFGMLCAVALSLISICVAYFSLLEDGLMRIFAEHGLDLRATVVETQFLRGAVTATPLVLSDNNDDDRSARHMDARNEYNAVIEYMAPGMDPKEQCTVTKQVKVYESDLMEIATIPPTINVDVADFVPVYPAQSRIEEILSSGQPSGLDILVLESHPRSAIPRKQAERATTVRYRLPTILLVLFLLALSTFCVHVSVGTIPHFPFSGAKATAVVTAVMLMTEVVSVHLFLGGMFREALKDVYLEGGDLAAATWTEESTISSNEEECYSQI
ncbi:hypothetical protein ACA910_021153 [Epithemia clementina (nom. ined.)]